MEIEILKKDEVNLSFLIRGVDVTFINSLRRLITAGVPAMAIDEVIILENSSMLQDEVVAHRLGFIPLKTDIDGYNLAEDCECKSEFGCNLCRASLSLDVEAEEGTKTVYSGELIPENPEIVPVSDKIPIVKLAKGQKLRLEAYARLGRGKNHVRWQPVSKSTYKYFPKLNILGECDSCKKCVEICPRKVLTKKDGRIDVINLQACILCQDCVDICPKKPPNIEVNWEKNTFIMNLESTKALFPERIVMEASKILGRELNEFEKKVKEA